MVYAWALHWVAVLSWTCLRPFLNHERVPISISPSLDWDESQVFIEWEWKMSLVQCPRLLLIQRIGPKIKSFIRLNESLCCKVPVLHLRGIQYSAEHAELPSQLRFHLGQNQTSEVPFKKLNWLRHLLWKALSNRQTHLQHNPWHPRKLVLGMDTTYILPGQFCRSVPPFLFFLSLSSYHVVLHVLVCLGVLGQTAWYDW